MPFPHFIHAPLKSIKSLFIKGFFDFVPRKRGGQLEGVLGINLIGYYKTDLGLGDALRYAAKALLKVNIPFLVRQFDVQLRATQNNRSMEPYLKTKCTYPINCIVINPDLIYRLPTWLSYPEWARRYNIAYWFWELPHFPKEWRYAIPLVDEIWVNTEFNANAMRQAHTRVIKIPFAVEFEHPSPLLNRSYFDLPEDAFLFLTSFDFHSSVSRKNPQAAISAFLKAFPGPHANARLVVKSINGHLHPNEFAQMQDQANQDPRIVFMDRHLSTEETRGLMQCANCYVSLHRSEGLGLGMAESMYLGKPVIATAYSGNVEFMNTRNAYLVAYEEIAVLPEDYPHAQNQVWANPSVEDASLGMKKMVGDPAWAKGLGEQARADMLEHHSFAAMGKAIQERLQQITSERTQ